MKALYFLPFAVILAGCESKPTVSDIEKSLNAELQAQCSDAKVSNVVINSIVKPNSQNANLAEVSFNADVTLKFSDELKKKRENQIAANKLYDQHYKAVLENIPELQEMAFLEEQRLAIHDQRASSNFVDIENVIYYDEGASYEDNIKRSSEVLNSIGKEAAELRRKANLREGLHKKKFAEDSKGLLSYFETKTLDGELTYSITKPSDRNVYQDGCMVGAGHPKSLLWMLRISRTEAGLNDDAYFNQGYTSSFVIQRNMAKADSGWIFRN